MSFQAAARLPESPLKHAVKHFFLQIIGLYFTKLHALILKKTHKRSRFNRSVQKYDQLEVKSAPSMDLPGSWNKHTSSTSFRYDKHSTITTKAIWASVIKSTKSAAHIQSFKTELLCWDFWCKFQSYKIGLDRHRRPSKWWYSLKSRNGRVQSWTYWMHELYSLLLHFFRKKGERRSAFSLHSLRQCLFETRSATVFLLLLFFYVKICQQYCKEWRCKHQVLSNPAGAEYKLRVQEKACSTKSSPRWASRLKLTSYERPQTNLEDIIVLLLFAWLNDIILLNQNCPWRESHEFLHALAKLLW